MSVLNDAVSQEKDGTWSFRCPGVKGDRCGDKGVPFSSTGWPTKKVATARGGQHLDEHRLSAEILSAVRDARAQSPHRVDVQAVAQEAMSKSKFTMMQELHDFRIEQGLVVNDDGSVSVEDL